jgi:hypothetical protein
MVKRDQRLRDARPGLRAGEPVKALVERPAHSACAIFAQPYNQVRDINESPYESRV